VNEIIAGIFIIASTIIGAGITYLSNKNEKNWKRIKEHVSILSEQLMAYNKLEEIYSQKLSELSESNAAPITIKIKMRDQVGAMPGYSRPEISPARIKSIKSRWSA